MSEITRLILWRRHKF